MKMHKAIFAIVALMSQTVFADVCKPGDNCKLPDCRCWSDTAPPGGFKPADIPQMVILSYEYSVNEYNVEPYRNLIKDILNPNKCQASGTFFVQKNYTDFSVVKALYESGFEIGITSSDGKKTQDWVKAFSDTKQALEESGIPANDIKGMRAPEFSVGGDDQLQGMVKNNLTYDSSCLTVQHMRENSLLWPYTYDFVEGTPGCVIGTPPTKAFPGKWQFLVADLQFAGHDCAVPSACAPYLKTTHDVYNFFYDSFAAHYNQKNRAPFLLTLDPTWFLEPSHYFDGTRQFLEFIRAAFDDVWIVSTEQALSWIRNPVKASAATSFKPWQCSN